MSYSICTNCGDEVPHNESHQANWDPDIFACTCRTGRSLTIVALEYNGNHYPPNYFYQDDMKNGIFPIESDREIRTFEALRYSALSEEAGFTSQPYPVVRLFWEKGEVIGFYTDNDYFGDHGIGHIFVRKEFRRKGYATAMVENFLTAYPTGDVYILSPNNSMYNVLEKMGLCKQQGDIWRFIGRLKHIQAM